LADIIELPIVKKHLDFLKEEDYVISSRLSEVVSEMLVNCIIAIREVKELGNAKLLPIRLEEGKKIRFRVDLLRILNVVDVIGVDLDLFGEIFASAFIILVGSCNKIPVEDILLSIVSETLLDLPASSVHQASRVEIGCVEVHLLVLYSAHP
jgi:hypothetical protein